MHKLNAASVIILASVSGQALADVVFYDNSDLTYFMVPSNVSPSLNGGFYNDFASTRLYLYASPVQNASGFMEGPSLGASLDRHPGSSFSTTGDGIGGFTDTGTFSLAHTGQGIIVGTNNEDRSELVTYQPGDTVEPSDFMTPIYNWPPRSGSITWYEYGSGPFPIYAPETYLGYKVEEPEGTRYGYFRITFMQDLEFEHLDEDGSPTGITVTRDLYVVTGWGYETELDTPAVVTDEATPNCLADTNGDGQVTPADFSAWVAAFNTNAPECDQNNDGMCTPADFSAWVTNYNAGC